MTRAGKSASGTLFAIAGGLLLFVLIIPAVAQTRKKAHPVAVPRTAQIVSEDGVPDPMTTNKFAADPASAAANANAGSAYRTSLQDLVALRETELTAAVDQQKKMGDLFRDGLVSKKAVDDSADAIVEARAKLEDARMRLAAIDPNPAVPADVDAAAATDAVTEPSPAATAPAVTAQAQKPALKRTSIVRPKRRAPKTD